MTMHQETLNKFLNELVAGKRSDWPNSIFIENFLEEVSNHAVGPLLYSLYAKDPLWTNWPKQVRESLSKEAAKTTLVNEAYRKETEKVIELLANARVPTILLKGINLAHSLYSSPELRPFCDIDILIKESDLEKLINVLKEYGYQESRPLMGSAIRFEHNLERSGPGNVSFLLDVHWKLSSLQVLTKKLSFKSLKKHTKSIKKISLSALGLDDHYALIHACTHLLAQHRHSPDLIWLYDIYLLLKDKDKAWYQTLDRIIDDTALAPFCATAILRTQNVFNISIPQVYFSKWQNIGSKETKIAASYINSSGRWFDNVIADLSALASLSEKALYLLQHLLPPPAFMLYRYQVENKLVLPFLYIYRILSGAWKLCAPRG